MPDYTNRKENFFATNTGRYIIIGICCLIIWGITYTLWVNAPDVSGVVILICAFFGWRALNRIQPAMFIWLPWGGWVVYIVVKLILSAIIGLFVAPFVLGNMIGNVIHGMVSSR